MKKRKSVSKKTRFEVFKRDGFACQYCGANSQKTQLEIDHVNPVANGGGNEIDNLVSACVDCNRGKAARLLTLIPESLSEKAKAIRENSLKIIDYVEIIHEKQERLNREVKMVDDLFEKFHPGHSLLDRELISVKKFIEALGVVEVLGCLEIAESKNRYGDSFRYFCGICWAKIRDKNVNS